jgi:hypothetical protein
MTIAKKNPKRLFIAITLMLLSSAAKAAPTNPQRAAAATAVVNTAPQCKAIQPFYWEIGDSKTRIVGGTACGNAPDAATVMPIASASKWLFGVLARHELGAKTYYKRVQCGREIRKAWLAAKAL